MRELENEMSIRYFYILSIFLILMIFTFIGICYYENNSENKRLMLEQEILEAENLKKENVIKYVKKDLGNLYDDSNLPKENITDEEVEILLNDINQIDDEEIKSSLLLEIAQVNQYRDVERKLNTLLVNDVLISNYKDSDIEELEVMVVKLPDDWKLIVNPKIDIINTQRNNIQSANQKVRNLYSDSNLTKVKNNVTRKDYNDAKKSVDRLPQKDLKKNHSSNLERVLKYIEEKEEKARIAAEEKARKEAEIKAAWVILETPYISQNNNKIYNGCEAAALLMGLQYKGYLRSTSLKTFVDAMPKSEDDPHEGFVRDIYGVEPRDVPHWIAPDALARYGRSYSGNSNIVDITGTSVSGLKRELDNGNPVVIYATGSNFADPVNWIEEVPKNVHVMLLIGYNPKSGQMLINDPWTRNGTGKVYISESRFTTIYNQIGKKAVAVR